MNARILLALCLLLALAAPSRAQDSPVSGAEEVRQAVGAMDENEVRAEALMPVPSPEPQAAAPAPDPAWEMLLGGLEADGLPRAELEALFSRPEVRFDPAYMGKKLRTLYKTKYLPRPPVQPGPHKTIWETWLTPANRAEIAAFMKANAKTLAAAEKKYGLPRQVLVAILMVETKLGKYCGERPALTVLASMAATRDYAVVSGYLKEFSPTPAQLDWLKMRQAQKADWAYDELKAFLELYLANHLDPLLVPGSIYGAIGLCQFMPTNALKLGVDGNRDGKLDLFAPADAIHSAANYLKNAGWRKGLNHNGQMRVIMRYNHDRTYAGTVLAIAKRI
ncbi:lytic murein transglycosylase [Desulfovibrio sp.]